MQKKTGLFSCINYIEDILTALPPMPTTPLKGNCPPTEPPEVGGAKRHGWLTSTTNPWPRQCPVIMHFSENSGWANPIFPLSAVQTEILSKISISNRSSCSQPQQSERFDGTHRVSSEPEWWVVGEIRNESRMQTASSQQEETGADVKCGVSLRRWKKPCRSFAQPWLPKALWPLDAEWVLVCVHLHILLFT